MSSQITPDTQAAPEPLAQPRETQMLALARSREASWHQLLPRHRLPVIAKSPFMVALGVYLAGGSFAQPAVWFTMALTAALWASLYVQNESTDLIDEQNYRVDRRIQTALFALPIMCCGLAALLSPMLGLLCALMTVGQFAYCVPPLRLKRFWWAVLVLSGTINPILRLQCGAIWGRHAITPLAYAVFILLHLGASLRARSLQRERDRGFAYRVAPPGIERVGMACSGLGFLGAYRLCAAGELPAVFALFTTLALLFAIYAWSGRATSVAQLRQGWLWFAILAAVALCALLARH